MGSTTEQLVTNAMQYPDYLVIILAFMLFMAYGFARHTKAMSELALSIPVAAFIYTLIPYELSIGAPAVFGILVVASAWVLSRDTSGLDDDNDLHKIILGSLGATGLLLVVVHGTVDFTSIYTFGGQITTILTDGAYRFYITIATLVAVALSRKI